MPLRLANNSQSILTAAIDNTVTSLDVLDASSFSPLAVGDWMWLTIIDQTLDTNFEIIKVTEIVGNTFTIVRGQEGTTARAAVSGDIIEQRITRQTLLDLGVGSESIKPRKYLDEIYFSLINAPKFTNINSILTDKYAPLLLGSESVYNNDWGPYIKFQLQNMTTGVITDNLDFPTVNDMLTWITANVNENLGLCTETIIARPYEIIDETIPVMTKMYGLNRFYSSLRGRRNYSSSTSTAVNSADMETQCAQLYNGVWGTSFTNVDIDLGAIWLSAAKKNLYGHPMFRITEGYRVFFELGCLARKVRNGTDTAWKVNTDDTYYLNDPSTFGWASMNFNSTTVTTHQYSEALDVIESHSRGASCVMICGVEEYDNGNGEKAVVVKPMGIDQVVTNLPDFTKYHFEIVFMNDERQAFVAVSRFSSIADFYNTDFDINGAKMRINSSEWLEANSNSGTLRLSSNKWNQFNVDTVRFRLRDKTTNEVSNLSYAGIVTDKTHNISLRQMRIKNFEHGNF